MRRRVKTLTRFTKAFSNRFENHRHALALYFVFYNSCRERKTLGFTAALAAGLAPVLKNVADTAGLISAKTSRQTAVRGTYKKKLNETST